MTGGSRRDACLYETLHGRVGAPDTGERFEPENAQPDSLCRRPGCAGIDRSGKTACLTFPGEPPRPVFVSRWHERLVDVYWLERNYVVHTCAPREWVTA